jgi:hypothetical protein
MTGQFSAIFFSFNITTDLCMRNMLLLYVSANELLGYLTEKYSMCVSWNSAVLTKTTKKLQNLLHIDSKHNLERTQSYNYSCPTDWTRPGRFLMAQHGLIG